MTSVAFSRSIFTSPGEATKIRSRRNIGPIVGTLLIAFSINHLTYYGAGLEFASPLLGDRIILSLLPLRISGLFNTRDLRRQASGANSCRGKRSPHLSPSGLLSHSIDHE